jgi:hypothetical protein
MDLLCLGIISDAPLDELAERIAPVVGVPFHAREGTWGIRTSVARSPPNQALGCPRCECRHSELIQEVRRDGGGQSRLSSGTSTRSTHTSRTPIRGLKTPSSWYRARRCAAVRTCWRSSALSKRDFPTGGSSCRGSSARAPSSQRKDGSLARTAACSARPLARSRPPVGMSSSAGCPPTRLVAAFLRQGRVPWPDAVSPTPRLKRS